MWHLPELPSEKTEKEKDKAYGVSAVKSSTSIDEQRQTRQNTVHDVNALPPTEWMNPLTFMM